MQRHWEMFAIGRPRTGPAAISFGSMTGETFEHPSGRQHEIRHGDQRAVVVQVGGGLREYEVAGFPVVDGYGAGEMAHSGRGQVLMPWPNRLADGRYEHDGRTLQAPLSEPDRHNAIHGLLRWRAWDVVESVPERVRLGHVLWPRAGYPFTLALEVEYELSETGLRVTMRAENVGAERAPYGAGHHPYVRAELGRVDATVLRLPATRFLELDMRQVPTGRLIDVAGSPYDFREGRPIGDTRLDNAFTAMERDVDGLARVEVRAPDGGRRVTVWLDRGFEHLMVFTGDGLSEAEQRRSVAIEPMTCAPDAFNNRLGLLVLEPGQSTSATWGITVQG
jgi:aldose 1-epimerase